MGPNFSDYYYDLLYCSMMNLYYELSKYILRQTKDVVT